ncbi:MAG: hypothetical protein ACTTKF_08540, partial [Bacteroides sp.]
MKRQSILVRLGLAVGGGVLIILLFMLFMPLYRLANAGYRELLRNVEQASAELVLNIKADLSQGVRLGQTLAYILSTHEDEAPCT